MIKAIGHYNDTNEDIPYALKVYSKVKLNMTVPDATGLGLRKLRDQVEDEVMFWGKLKHDNVVKVFIWYEDTAPKGHDKSYLMMQFADMGAIAEWRPD